MRAFLSHSSANKDVVFEIFNELGSANAEYDDRTFESGKFNTEAIRDGLSRCDLFVLIATKKSLESGFVAYEISQAIESLASGKIKKILTFCYDGTRPEDLPNNLRSISAVRRSTSTGTTARLVKSTLIEMQITTSRVRNPFLGRESISRDIKDKLAAPEEPTPIAICFSGVDGVGRRTLATRVLSDVYPNTAHVHPVITLNPSADNRDIYRSLLETFGNVNKSELFEKASEFEKLEPPEQVRSICEMIIRLNTANEIIYCVDNGGALDNSGAFSLEMKSIFDHLRSVRAPIPYFVFILFRTPPASARERRDVIYFRVESIELDDIQNLLSLQIKRKGLTTTKADVRRLAELTDGHPYNIQFVIRLLDSQSIESIIDDPTDLTIFKKRQGDEFIAKIKLNEHHISILSVLRVLGQTALEVLSVAVTLDAGQLGTALRQLEEFHCIERVGSVCAISRPLRAALERSSRLKLSDDQITKLQTDVIEIFQSYKNEDQIDVEVVSTAARAATYLNRDDEALKAFLAPSSALFVARQFFDQRRYRQCSQVCQTVLVSKNIISDSARTEVIRLRCLSLARIAEDSDFTSTLSLLRDHTNREKAAKLFLEGFRWRVRGEPAKAVPLFKRSEDLEKGSYSTLRELTYCLMQIGEVEEAEQYAAESLKLGPTNPYIIDQVLSLRIAKMGKITRDIVYNPEISELLGVLERFGDEEGRSFYSIRMADIYRRAGAYGEAIDFAERATVLTPSLMAAHLVEAEILIKSRQLDAARRKVDSIERMIDDKGSGEGKSMLPEYLMLKAEYLFENNEIKSAVTLLYNSEHRLKKRSADLKKKIASTLRTGNGELTSAQIVWLKT